MENFFTLKDTERLRLLIQNHIFAPPIQLALLFSLNSRISRSNRAVLYNRISSNLLVFDWLKEFKKWSKGKNLNKKKFVLNALYFIKEKHIKKYTEDSMVIENKNHSPALPEENNKRETPVLPEIKITDFFIKTNKIGKISVKGNGYKVKKINFLSEGIKEISIKGSETKKEIKQFFIKAPEEDLKGKEKILEKELEKKEKKILYDILDIIKLLQNDPSQEIKYLTSAALASLALQSHVFLDYWKKLLACGDPAREHIALSGMGEFLNSSKNELIPLTEALKSYYEEKNLNKAVKNLKKKLKIKTEDPAVFLIPLGAFQIYHPEVADMVTGRDFSGKICAVNIIKSFSFSLTYLNNFKKEERLQVAGKIYKKLAGIKEKFLLPLAAHLKFSKDDIDYNLFLTYFQTLQEFCYTGINEAFYELISFLDYEIPESFKFELISIIDETNSICKNKFGFFINKLDAKNISQKHPLFNYIRILSRLKRLNKKDFSRETSDEIYRLIKDFKKVMEHFFQKIENYGYYDDIYLSVIRPLAFILEGDFLSEIPCILEQGYTSGEEDKLIEKTLSLFIKDCREFIKKRLSDLLADKKKPETSYIALCILKRFSSVLEINQETFYHLCSESHPAVIAGLLPLFSSHFKEIIIKKDENRLIDYLRKMSFYGATEKLYRAIASSAGKPGWFVKLVNNFAIYHSDSFSWKDEKASIVFTGVLSDIIATKKETGKKYKFWHLCQTLLKSLKAPSVREIQRILDKLDFEIFLPFKEKDNLAGLCKEYINNLKLYLTDYIKVDFSDFNNKENMEFFLLKGAEETEKTLNFLEKKGDIFLDKFTLLSLKRILYVWINDIFSKTIKELRELSREIRDENPEGIYYRYGIIKKSSLFEASEMKNLEGELQKYLLKMAFQKEVERELVIIMEFLNELHFDQNEANINFIDFYCRLFPFESTWGLIAPVFADYLIDLYKNENHEDTVNFIYKLLECGAKKEVFLLTIIELKKKSSPHIIISLMEAYAEVMDENTAPEKIWKLLSSLKEFASNCKIDIPRIESYDVFLEMARSIKTLKSLVFTLDKLRERGKFHHGLYGCIEKNGFYLIEKDLFPGPEENISTEKEKQGIKNEKTWLSITKCIDELECNLKDFQKTPFENFEYKIKYLENSLYLLGEIKKSAGNIIDPVSKKILINLYVDKLCIKVEEDPEPETGFNINKLLKRWKKIKKLINNSNLEELTEKIYLRKDICNYLQINGEELKDFKSFILKSCYKSFEYDRAIYLNYMDKAYREREKESLLTPSPFEEIADSEVKKQKIPLFTSMSLLLLFVFFFLPPLLGTQSINIGGISLNILFFGTLLYSFITTGSFLIFHKFKKLNYRDIYIFIPEFFFIFLPVFIFLSANREMWIFALSISDPLFLVLAILSLLTTFFYIFYKISGLSRAGNTMHKSLNIILRAWIEAFLMSLVISTLFSPAFKIASGLYNGVGNLSFLFNTLPEERNISFLFSDLVLYPSVIYTWTFIALFFSIFKFSFQKEK